MTKQEYVAYQARVEEFFSHGLENLSIQVGCDEPSFSQRECDVCGTDLGGSRYECDGYNSRTQQAEEYFSVCQDCVYYAEYGKLDDETMDTRPYDGKNN